jgi:hypothetical protein
MQQHVPCVHLPCLSYDQLEGCVGRTSSARTVQYRLISPTVDNKNTAAHYPGSATPLTHHHDDSNGGVHANFQLQQAVCFASTHVRH